MKEVLSFPFQRVPTFLRRLPYHTCSRIQPDEVRLPDEPTGWEGSRGCDEVRSATDWQQEHERGKARDIEGAVVPSPLRKRLHLNVQSA